MCNEVTSNKSLALNNLRDISKVKNGSLETRAVLIEISSVMLRFTKRPKTRGSL